MVQTRSDKKFSTWSFTLDGPDSLPYLYRLAPYCDRLSYSPSNEKIKAKCMFKKKYRYDDVSSALSNFASDIRPRVSYQTDIEVPVPNRINHSSLIVLIIIAFLLYKLQCTPNFML